MTEHQKGILLSSMSASTAAMMLGWSVNRVLRARLTLNAEPAKARPKPEAPCRLSVLCGARVHRWCRAFLVAGWTVTEVAWLFDLEAELVATALPAGDA